MNDFDTFEIDTQFIANTMLTHGETAQFEFGTMFARCSENTIDAIIARFHEMKLKTQVSQFAGQYAIDFIA